MTAKMARKVSSSFYHLIRNLAGSAIIRGVVAGAVLAVIVVTVHDHVGVSANTLGVAIFMLVFATSAWHRRTLLASRWRRDMERCLRLLSVLRR